MVKIGHSLLFLGFCVFVASAGPVCAAAESALSEPSSAEAPKDLEGIWDAAKYIGLEEIRPGVEAYCLTDYGDAGVEKFGLEVVDVVDD